MHGLRHEDRRIVDDDGRDAGREILLQVLYGVEHFVLHLQRVRAGQREDQQRQAFAAVHVGGGTVVGRADLHTADVADAGRAPLRIGFQDDVGELLRRAQAAERLDVELIRRVAGHRRLVQDAGGDLQVLCAQRREHLARVEVVGGHLVGIEPDAHRVVASAEQLHVAHARQPRQRVLHVQGRVVREIEVVARPVGRVQMHRKQDVRRRLAHLHAQPLHVVRQSRQRVLHPVLRQHLRDIEIRANPEGDRDGEVAVSGGLAAHVDHVLDAVDRLLERRRDRLADHLGGGAGIAGGHLHRRRHDLRILRDRQDHQRAETDQREEHAEHRRQDGAIDEEMGETHRALP